jgi:hypothetical protein
MTIDCACIDYDYGDFTVYWHPSDTLKPLESNRAKRCASCNDLIKIGQPTSQIERFRGPRSDIEERIYGEEVQIAPYYHCEKCTELSKFIHGMGWCYSLGDNLQKELDYATEHGFGENE